MAKLSTVVALPSSEEITARKASWEQLWQDLTSALVYYLQAIISRVNDELVGNIGAQSIDGELYISEKFGVGTSSRLTWMAAAVSNMNPGVVPKNGGQVEVSVTLTGVQPKDEVLASPDTGVENNIMWSAYVSAADTVKVRLINSTIGDITMVARDWTIVVRRYI